MEATDINFEEMLCFSEIYTSVRLQNYSINFEEIHWFSEIYTCFGIQKYLF